MICGCLILIANTRTGKRDMQPRCRPRIIEARHEEIRTAWEQRDDNRCDSLCRRPKRLGRNTGPAASPGRRGGRRKWRVRGAAVTSTNALPCRCATLRRSPRPSSPSRAATFCSIPMLNAEQNPSSLQPLIAACVHARSSSTARAGAQDGQARCPGVTAGQAPSMPIRPLTTGRCDPIIGPEAAVRRSRCHVERQLYSRHGPSEIATPHDSGARKRAA
jgi:hypothetical protein